MGLRCRRHENGHKGESKRGIARRSGRAVAYFSTLSYAANAPSVPRMTADALKELDELDIANAEYVEGTRELLKG